MKPTTIATVRTVTPLFWAGVIVDFIRRRTGIEVTPTELVTVLVPVLAVTYRVGRELERRWPWLGRILFGSTSTPTYTLSTPKD